MAATTVTAETETRTLKIGEHLPPGVYLDVEYLGAGRLRFVRLPRNCLASLDKSSTMIHGSPSDPATGEAE